MRLDHRIRSIERTMAKAPCPECHGSGRIVIVHTGLDDEAEAPTYREQPGCPRCGRIQQITVHHFTAPLPGAAA